MSATDSHGRCSRCDVIFVWTPRGRWRPRVTKGEAFCPICGCELSRTAARLATNIEKRRRDPIGAREGAALRARRHAPAVPS